MGGKLSIRKILAAWPTGAFPSSQPVPTPAFPDVYLHIDSELEPWPYHSTTGCLQWHQALGMYA
jgi:hypothetical protein